jgi:hypothetical protein
MREKLRTLAWPVPFLMDQYGEGYAASLRGDGAASPGVMLLTREGRVIFQGPWREGTLSARTSALDGAFGSASAQAESQHRQLSGVWLDVVGAGRWCCRDAPSRCPARQERGEA